MTRYNVSGTREVDGETREFEVPVSASSRDEAGEQFLDSVEYPDEFTIEEVE